MPRNDSFERAAARASTQYGLVSLAQLRECAVSTAQLRALIATNRLHRVALGVYRFAGTADHRNIPLMQLTLRSDGTASHRSAAALLGLIDWLPRPEVTVARMEGYRGPGRIHRHPDIEPRHRHQPRRLRQAQEPGARRRPLRVALSERARPQKRAGRCRDRMKATSSVSRTARPLLKFLASRITVAQRSRVRLRLFGFRWLAGLDTVGRSDL